MLEVRGSIPSPMLALRLVVIAQSVSLSLSIAQTHTNDNNTGCASDLDCHLNGLCQKDGSCACDAAWMGSACAKLALLPTSTTGDLRLPNISTWGMSVVQHGGMYHGFFAEMERGCGLTSWETNSIVSHAIAESPAGPWTRHGRTLGVWSHTPSAVVAGDGTILLFHMGNGSNGGALNGSREYNAKCEAGRSPCGTHPSHHCGPHSLVADGTGTDSVDLSAREHAEAPTLTFHVSNDPAGPWISFTANSSTDFGQNALNTPMVHPNGTVYVVTGDRTILRAYDWRGPYEQVATHACGNGEDNYLYIDKRGNWHCLYHKAPFPDPLAQGGHAFSTDGLVWHEGAEAAYPAQQVYTDGRIGKYGKRERPHLIFDPVSREPAYLTNGVCLNSNWTLCNNNPWPGYFDLTFTAVSPIRTAN